MKKITPKVLIDAIEGIEKAVINARLAFEKNELILEAMTQELLDENKKLNKQVAELAKEVNSEKTINRYYTRNR